MTPDSLPRDSESQRRRRCIGFGAQEGTCEGYADGHLGSPLWCDPCERDRREHITAQMEKITASFADEDDPLRHPETGRIIPRLRFWLDGGYDRFLVEECEYHPDHQWTVIRVIDAKPEHTDPEERMAICKGCFVPRCGYVGEHDPCVLPRHHPELHLYASGAVEDNSVWPGSDKPPPPFDIDPFDGKDD